MIATLVSCVVLAAQPLSEQPYLGLILRDSDSGPVVSWIYPGPFGGTGFGSTSGIQRSDNVDAVYLGKMSPEARVPISSAAQFHDLTGKLAVGSVFSIEYRRSPEADINAAIPKGGPGGEAQTLTVTVADRDTWTGTIARGLGARVIDDLAEGEFERALIEDAKALGIFDAEGGLGQLIALLGRTLDASLDPNMLPAVVQGFRRPLSLDEIEANIGGLAYALGQGEPSKEQAIALVSAVLDVPARALDPAADGAEWQSRAEQLVRAMRDSVYIYDEHAADHIALIRRSMTLAPEYIGAALQQLDWIDRFWQPAAAGSQADIPEQIRQAVTGEITGITRLRDDRIVVVGGEGPNTYDMSRIALVYDPGGDDTYTWPTGSASLGTPTGIFDRAGDDRYVSNADFAGPGAGVFGLSIVEDLEGDDVYESTTIGSLAFGLFGVGMIVDHAGHDVYRNTGPGSGWAIGAGFYGAGLIVDRSGDDTYEGEKLVQGVGGPRGLGAVLDCSGNDSYKANGPNFGSVYGTPGVFVGMSQGFGMGVRGYAAGGLGALWDLAGDDTYEAGEFSQACGYFFAMGILHDFAGNDRYRGNRYGQGTGAHQALGLLIDNAGDDHYWSMTAASQGGTWDLTVGMLIDQAGNDVYQADGLAQGSASMQAIGILIDAGGDDSYMASGAACQGQGGSNTYHFDAERVFSFSALLDLGSGTDTYSSGRQNNTIAGLGARNEQSPGDSTLYGIFDDQ
ncbi:MAG: hypothetical protein Kow0022_10030 [Phycisphaerales bacterium]